jgi:hypothetical protein
MAQKICDQGRKTTFTTQSASSRLMYRSKQGSSFDHLVGTCEQRLRHGDAKRLRGFQIDHQFVFGRRLHRQIARLLAFQNAIGIAGGALELIDRVRRKSNRRPRHIADAGYALCS